MPMPEGIVLGIDTLATAHMRFLTLAQASQMVDIRNAWRLAGDITDSLSRLRARVSEVIIRDGEAG
jgi:hypothetical protein